MGLPAAHTLLVFATRQACEGDDDGTGTACTLNADGSACAVLDGDSDGTANCVFTEGAERYGDEWAYNSATNGVDAPNGGSGGYCSTDADCAHRVEDR